MACLHCKSNDILPLRCHPFPYTRIDKSSGKVVEIINKFHCVCCNGEYSEEYRHSLDYGLNTDVYYFQQFSYGRYKYKDFTVAVKELPE